MGSTSANLLPQHVPTYINAHAPAHTQTHIHMNTWDQPFAILPATWLYPLPCFGPFMANQYLISSMKAGGGHPDFHTKEPDQSCIPAENLTQWLTPSNTTNVKCCTLLQGHSSDQSSSIHPAWSSSLVCFTDDDLSNTKRGRMEPWGGGQMRREHP